MSQPTVSITLTDPNTGEDEHHDLPGKWEICHTCRGNGRHSIALGAFTSDEFDEMGPDFQDDYMAGFYDSTCDSCNGTGKVIVVDEARCDPVLLVKYEAELEEEAEYQAMVAAERRMGC